MTPLMEHQRRPEGSAQVRIMLTGRAAGKTEMIRQTAVQRAERGERVLIIVPAVDFAVNAYADIASHPNINVISARQVDHRIRGMKIPDWVGVDEWLLQSDLGNLLSHLRYLESRGAEIDITATPDQISQNNGGAMALLWMLLAGATLTTGAVMDNKHLDPRVRERLETIYRGRIIP